MNSEDIARQRAELEEREAEFGRAVTAHYAKRRRVKAHKHDETPVTSDGPGPGITWEEALSIESEAGRQALAAVVRLGHTEHCAKRQAWGDGECECRPNHARDYLSAVRPLIEGNPAYSASPMPPDALLIGDALRLLRERSGHTMGDLARWLGVNVSTVSDLERGRVEAARRILADRPEPVAPPDFGSKS